MTTEPDSNGALSRQPAEIDRVIHEPARLLILSHLFVLEGADFLFLMRQMGMTQGNLSSHMSKLEAAGYVAVEKRGGGRASRTMFRLTDAGRSAVRDYSQRMRGILDGLVE